MDIFSYYLAAFILGLMGSGHCLFMCGGLMSALTLGQPSESTPKILFFSNLGRLTSYCFIGILIGFLGVWLADQHQLLGKVLRSIGGCLLILMGLYIAQWYPGLKAIERIGAGLWRKSRARLSPNLSKPSGMFLFGILWGWLPCGLIYSTLVWASTQASSPMQAGLLMLFFGFGTLPMVATTGLFSQTLSGLIKRKYVNVVMGITIMAFGLWTIAAPWLMSVHQH